jgi:uncharacterized protein
MLNIAAIKSQNLLLFECISGSRAYGTDLPTSDTDLKGVFVMPRRDFYGLEYIPQVSSEKNDETYFELKRFAELLSKNNPAVLEMLHVPDDCLLYCHPAFRPFLDTRFLSKLCKDTFAGYAISQIKKARGLNKKINYPAPPERKTPLDFCFVAERQGAVAVVNWLAQRDWQLDRCGLAAIPHMRDLYGLYYDVRGDLNFSGIIRKEQANEVALSSIPPDMAPVAYLSFNKDAYSMHCREYRSYQEWVTNRNDARYQNTLEHCKNYDAKNMMHTIRLLDMAVEILESGTIQVRRPNRDELLAIRSGAFGYEELIELAEARIRHIEAIYERSPLPDTPDIARIEQLLVAVREAVCET